MDGKTRDSHRKLDGQIREVDEPFEVDGMKADAPGMFGDPAEDCNCRCALLQRARWALDESELETLRERASFHGLLVDDSKEFGHEKAKDFSDYINNYMNAIKGADSERVRSSTQKINHEDIRAIYDYMSIKSYDLNNNLRNDTLTDEDKKLIERIDSALKKMPDYNGNLQRSLYFEKQEQLSEFLKDYKIGGSITYKEYISTTKDEDEYNPEGQVLIYIPNSTKGKDISEINAAENEILYMRNSKFKVLNRVETNGKHFILLEELNE